MKPFLHLWIFKNCENISITWNEEQRERRGRILDSWDARLRECMFNKLQSLVISFWVSSKLCKRCTRRGWHRVWWSKFDGGTNRRTYHDPRDANIHGRTSRLPTNSSSSSSSSFTLFLSQHRPTLFFRHQYHKSSTNRTFYPSFPPTLYI